MKLSNKAFTLIELLVVIAIIGILAAIVLAALGVTKNKGNDAKRISEIRQIRNALDIYYLSNGAYPCAIYTGGACTNTLQGSTAMPAPPKDPTGVNYTYAGLGSGATCTSFHLGGSLEDKKNSILHQDSDATAAPTVCTNGGTNFEGTSPATGGTACSATAGTAAPTAAANGETCYDVTP
jgi:general secretion pathway protein G